MLISAYAFGGMPEKAVKKTFSEADIYLTPDLLKEYRDVPLALEAAGKINRLQFKTLISGIAAVVSRAEIVNPKRKILICRDPKDDMLLECCIEAKADFLVTGDADLLNIADLPFNLRIVAPREFLKEG
ncbi:MAG: putative toxin-antitoxin system toxin component, PIN family [Deltaproteobacteria bacterium]|nr:putative toxin-antitoxin system toxin component, PIN family [Deltaproteobacteria bacterium]